jgi:hypothetical protein
VHGSNYRNRRVAQNVPGTLAVAADGSTIPKVSVGRGKGKQSGGRFPARELQFEARWHPRCFGAFVQQDNWQAKREIVLPLRGSSLCSLVRKRDAAQFPTLGIFRPASINRLRIAPLDPEWSEAELGMLRQTHLFVDAPKQQLEKIPFRFFYEFTCDEADCRGHNLMCSDWEMSQSYRQWRSHYGDAGWEEKFRQRYEWEMIHEKDTHFYVGTVASHPNRWIIIGLFYPPREVPSNQDNLF